MSKRTLFLALPIAAAMVLSACGGGSSADRPSAEELSEVFTSGAEELGGVELPQEQADCIAEALVDSDVSDETLRAMADLNEDYDASQDEQDLLMEAVTDAATECVTAG